MRGPVWLIAVVLTVGACDCEDQLRKLVSNSGDRRMPAEDKQQKTGGLTEAEPNDDPTSATAFTLGKELRDVRGTVASADDVDWYAFGAAEDEPFQVVVRPEVGLDISVHVEVEGGASLTYDEGRRGDAERIAALKVGPKSQRIVIRPQSGTTGSYTISFKRQLDAEGLEGEPNDDTSVATQFTMPGEVQGSYDRADDRDVYRLTGDPGHPYDLEIGAIAGSRHMARIFDDPKLGTPQLSIQVVDADVHIPNVVLSADRPRWLVMTPLSTARADQNYRIKATPHPKIDGLLEGEPNDVTPQPIAFAPPDQHGAREAVVSGYIHSADDRDRFEFTPPALMPTSTPIPQEQDEPDYLATYRTKQRPRVPIQAKLTWTNDQSAFGMRWLGADGTEVEFRQTSPTLEVNACGLNLEAGPAVIEVRAERLGAAPRVGVPQYTLSVVESSAGESFEAEPNDERNNADVLETARRGTFAVFDDADIFAFAVPGTGDETSKVKVQVGGRGIDVVFKIVDDGGGVVANVDNATIGSAEFVEVDLPPGLYFVEARWKGGDLCAPYAIELSR